MSYFVTGRHGIHRPLPGQQPAQAQGHASMCWCARTRRRSSTRSREEDGLGHEAHRPGRRRPDRSRSCGVAPRRSRALSGKVKHFFHLAAIYDLTAERREPARGQCRRHAACARPGRGDQGRLLPPHQLDRGRGPLPGRVPRGHVRRGRGPGRSLPAHQARFRRRSCAMRSAAVAHLPARHGRRPFADRRDRQDRRTVLLLHASSRSCARCCRRGCRRSASRAGASIIVPVDFVVDAMDHIAHKPRLDGHTLPPDRSGADAHRRSAQHLRARRPCAGDDDAHRRAHVRVRAERHPRRGRQPAAGASVSSACCCATSDPEAR